MTPQPHNSPTLPPGPTLPGLHHITAIAGAPQPNVEFYTRLLGQRLVKRTVNFDDPGTYHLYYGTGSGAPGTILTFFPWMGIAQGRRGTHQATEIQYRVPEGSLGWWAERLSAANAIVNGPSQRSGVGVNEEYLVVLDPDGLKLELVSSAEPLVTPYPAGTEGGVPEAKALRGFHGVTLTLEQTEPTLRLLTEVFGYTVQGTHVNRTRLVSADGGRVDVVAAPGERHGWVSGGTVHHVAFRARNDAHQDELREALLQRGFNVTPRLDRQYFHSIYFREPGGVLFEIATDPPGFTADEAPDQLGRALKLPPWLEADRAAIEAALPPLTI